MLGNTKLYSMLLFLLIYSSGCGAITNVILDNLNATENNQKHALIMIRQIATHQLLYLEEDEKLADPKDLGLPNYAEYFFEMQVKGKDFRIWATPRKYGWTGKVSYYFDTATCRIHGKDKKGGKANSKDPVIPSTEYYPRDVHGSIDDVFKKYYSCSQEKKMDNTELGWQSWHFDNKTGWKLVK